MKKLILVFVVFFLNGVACLAAAPDFCTIEDQEEYAVLAAVLFPNQVEIRDEMKNDLQRKAYLTSETVRLDGFHGSSYTIQDEAVPAKVPGASDRPMIEDFNGRNVSKCRIDAARLLALIPKGKDVTFVTAEQVRETFSSHSGEKGGWDGFRKKHQMAGGITYLSRPGFDERRTEAIVEVRHQADYEMGVGYRVYLRKSSKTGRWLITGAVPTRRS